MIGATQNHNICDDTMTLYRIERKKLSEQVMAYLEDDIIEGRLQPGDRLPSERALMEQFGVGRPAIREALFLLQKMGLVALSSGSRARVIRPTPEVVMGELAGVMKHLLARPDGQRDFQDARKLFECAMAREAARDATPEDIATLRRALAANREALGRDPLFKQTDVSLHREIAKIAGNRVFVAAHDAMAQWLDDLRAAMAQEEGQNEIALAAHERIVDAIESGDPEQADRVMREHLEQHYDTYRRVMEARRT